ncbi:MAG: bacterioferritin [Thermoanaerobaculum sp.]|nr:bacterioferritin [Thermoanaerobaculum sp.]
MRGQDQVIATLNELLADELSAINQYVVHAEMCANWGYRTLHKATEARAITEMRHAEKLIQRLLFLQGRPQVSTMGPVNIGERVEEQLRQDLQAEHRAVTQYNQAIRLCEEAKDHGTAELLRTILQEEEEHVDWLEAQQEQISQLGLPLYLAHQRGD